MVLRWVGRTCVAAGTILLLFVIYQLYGTGFITRHDQQELRKQFAQPLASSSAPVPITGTATPDQPQLGTGVAIMEIPRINLNIVVVQGVAVDDLKKGPGHWANSPLPGQAGNVVVSGHRTTYLHPFYNINELVPGDPIYLTNRSGQKFTYLVSATTIVAPSDVAVAANTSDNRLTLTTCNPRYSATQRMIVTAALQGPPIPGGGSGGAGPATIPNT